MQYRRLAALALATALAACGSDDGPGRSDTIDPSQARVTIVSGDGQSAQVPDPAPQSAIVPLAVVGEAMLPHPLVVRVTGDGPSSNIVGPSFAVVPEGTPVHWRIPGEGCGEPFGGTTVTDAVGQSTNRVILGTVAGTCEVQVGRVLSSGDVVIDSTFVYELLPGPVVAASNSAPFPVLSPGDSVWLPDVITTARDAHFNAIDPAALADHPAPQWAWAPVVAGGSAASEPTGEGWATVVPAEAAEWAPKYVHDGPNAVLRLWFQGVQRGGILVHVE